MKMRVNKESEKRKKEVSENEQRKKLFCVISSSLISETFHKSKLVASATRCNDKLKNVNTLGLSLNRDILD